MLFIADKIMYKIIINGMAEKLKINNSNIEVATKVILNILILVNKFSFFEILNEKNGNFRNKQERHNYCNQS